MKNKNINADKRKNLGKKEKNANEKDSNSSKKRRSDSGMSNEKNSAVVGKNTDVGMSNFVVKRKSLDSGKNNVSRSNSVHRTLHQRKPITTKPSAPFRA